MDGRMVGWMDGIFACWNVFPTRFVSILSFSVSKIPFPLLRFLSLRRSTSLFKCSIYFGTYVLFNNFATLCNIVIQETVCPSRLITSILPPPTSSDIDMLRFGLASARRAHISSCTPFLYPFLMVISLLQAVHFGMVNLVHKIDTLEIPFYSNISVASIVL